MFGWLDTNRPLTSILTDGSGRHGNPRLRSSAKLLTDIGAPIGSIFGLYSDRQIYSQVLAKDPAPFLQLADTLARQWVRHEIDVVLGDACEGTIMAHDLWRGVIDRAVHIASSKRGVPIRNLAFSLEADPREPPAKETELHSRTELSDADWGRKIRAAELYDGLQTEVHQAFSLWGKPAFRIETILVQPHPANTIDWLDKPPYERHGENQVSAGVYEQVVRYRDHVRPILMALRPDLAPGARAA